MLSGVIRELPAIKNRRHIIIRFPLPYIHTRMLRFFCGAFLIFKRKYPTLLFVALNN